MRSSAGLLFFRKSTQVLSSSFSSWHSSSVFAGHFSSSSGSSRGLISGSSSAAVLQQTYCSKFFSGGNVDSAQKIGFIGLGNMGSRMAANLLSAGHSLCVLDKVEDAMKALASKGAMVAKTPLQVAEESDVVITMLPASAHVQEVYTGSNGLLTGTDKMRPSLLIDCSTIDPHMSRLLAAKVAACKLSGNARNLGVDTVIMLDAPVSGGVGGAEQRTLTFMVGGAEEGLKAALPLFKAMGKRVVHCGGPGNGS